MQIKKTMMSMCMAAAMAGVTVIPAWASPEFSRSAEEWARLRDNTLEYGELEGLIQEYNATVLNNRVQYNLDKANSAEYMAEAYWRAAEAARQTAADVSDAVSGVTNPDILDAVSNQVIGLDGMARQQEAAAETYGRSQSAIWREYDKVEKDLVKQAQTTMNTYYQQEQQLIALRKSRELAQASYESAQVKQGQGMVTYADVLTAQQGVQSLDAQIAGMEAQFQSTRQKLCVMTGWAADANPEMVPIPAADVARVATLNLEADTAKALEQDYTLLNNQEKLKNAISVDKTELMKQTVENDKQQIAVAVNTAYQSVLQAKAAYDQAALDLSVAAKSLESANVKHQLGTIGRLEFLQQESAFVTAQTGMMLKDLALVQALETYDWTVKGVR